MSNFVPTQEQLDRWATIPMSFKTTKAVKSAFRNLGDFSHVTMGEPLRNRLVELSTRDSEGRWINLYDANRGGSQLTQLQAHQLLEMLDRIANCGVTVTRQTPKVTPRPATGHQKVSKSETIVKPPAGIYTLPNGARVQIKVNAKTGRTTSSVL